MQFKTIDIVNTEQSTIWLANRGVKSFATINEKYIVVASSGVVSIFPIQKNGKTTDTIWDNYYKRISGFNKKNNIWEYKILKNVRAKKIVYDSISNSIFVITNLGLYQISPYKTLMPKFKNELIFATQMANSKTIQSLLLLNNGGLLQYKNKQTFKEIKGIKHPIKFIKIVANRIFTADEQHIYQAQILNDSISFTKIFSFSEPGIINDIEFNQKTNQLIISTDNGIIFKKQENENTAPDYQFYINEIHVNGNPIEQAKVVELTSNQNNIEINYSVPDYNTNTQIYYKINDADWQPLQSNTRTLSLASLSPGKYKILFKINNQTNSNEILININKPWWLSWWFLLLVAMLLLSIIFGIYKWQIEVAKQKNNLLLEKIELEKNLHNSMLASIKSQMNPHFLFNALNTIQSFIISEEKKNASNYLSKFSKLTRMILEMSERNKITLNEELQALQLYLDLEKMRFEDLETEVITAIGLHLDEIKIPSMILQPYVENSIKHGLLHKKGNRKLRITFSKMQQNLKIEIDDNGIGRKKSEELNKIKFQKHQSFSTDANLKRIELLNKEQNNIGIEYIDKPDGAGTTVVILLPLQTN
jgi:two-component sensor histidine kinase